MEVKGRRSRQMREDAWVLRHCLGKADRQTLLRNSSEKVLQGPQVGGRGRESGEQEDGETRKGNQKLSTTGLAFLAFSQVPSCSPVSVPLLLVTVEKQDMYFRKAWMSYWHTRGHHVFSQTALLMGLPGAPAGGWIACPKDQKQFAPGHTETRLF